MKLCVIGNKDDKSALYIYEESKKFKEISHSILVTLPKLYIEGYEKIMYRDKDITNYNSCIMHVRCDMFPFSYLVSNILHTKKVALSHEPKASLYLSNRALLAKVFDRAKVKYPKTYLALSPEVSKNIVSKFDKIVFKLANVHGGKGVMVINEKSAAKSIVDSMHSTSKSFYMQEVIEGEVTKLLIIGEEVIGIKEIPKQGENRSNIAQSRISLRPSDELSEIGRKVAKEVGALCCEVDIIEKEGEYYAIDVCVDPDLLMYQKISGKNVANILLNAMLEKKEETKARWDRILWRKLARLLPLPPYSIC